MNSQENSGVKRYRERLKFYADTPRGEKNKFFCFEVPLIRIKDAIFRFWAKGFNIRAIYFENTDLVTGEIDNKRIPQATINELTDEYTSLSPKQRKLYVNVQINSSN